MGHDELVIIGRLTGALVFGAMIGFERSVPRTPGRLSDARARVSRLSLADARHRLSAALDDRGAARHHPRRSDAHGAGHHDRHRLPGRGCHLQGRPDGARADDRGVHLDNGRNRHPCRHRLLVSGNSRYDRGHCSCLLFSALSRRGCRANSTRITCCVSRAIARCPRRTCRS